MVEKSGGNTGIQIQANGHLTHTQCEGKTDVAMGLVEFRRNGGHAALGGVVFTIAKGLAIPLRR